MFRKRKTVKLTYRGGSSEEFEAWLREKGRWPWNRRKGRLQRALDRAGIKVTVK